MKTLGMYKKYGYTYLETRKDYWNDDSRIYYKKLDKQGFTEENMNSEFQIALDNLVNQSEVVIDRQKGTAHPRYPDLIYKVDYGFLKNTVSMDGGGIDVWVGTDEKKIVDAIMCIVDLKKRDSEIKILIGCTEEEKKLVYKTHNESAYMKGILIRRQK